MFDFPSSPTEGDTFTPPGGPSYIYHAPVWELVASAVSAALVPIADTPPATPSSGQLWFRSSDGILYIWFDDGSGSPSAQWVQTR